MMRWSPFRGRIVFVVGLLANVLARLGAATDSGSITEAPLAPRSGPRGATMFKSMDPARTGIATENNFADPKMWEEREKEFALGATGTGVAIGDYDNDGRPDLFVVSKTERCRLYRNLGDWKFEDVTDKAGLGGNSGWMGTAKSWVGLGGDAADLPERWKQGATFVDVNNDGRLDLYVCRFGAPNLLYMNQGDGTFKEEAAIHGLALNDASGTGNFCDYDRDGWMDVYVHTTMLDATAKPNGQRGRLLHNNGDGNFTEVTEHAGIFGDTISHSATWWDFDNDGWPDLYVANDFAAPDRLYRNNHDGTFTDVIGNVAPHVPYSSMGADLGDVNNDGLIDFFASDMAATTHEKDQRGIATSREQAVADFDPGVVPQYSRNALFLNTGTNYFLEAANLAGLAASDWTWSLRLEDLDNDGRLDVHVTNGMVREYQNSDLRDQIVRADTSAASRHIMRASPVFPERHLAFRNLGELKFEDVSAAWGLDQKAVSFGAAVGDFDGDGDLDLVFANYQAVPTVLRNDSDTGHRLVVALRGTRSNRFGAGSTVRIETAAGVQVRMLVLDRGYMSSSEPVLHFGMGEETAIKRLTIVWPSGHLQVFNNLAIDRRYTITEPAGPPRIEAQPAAGAARSMQFVEESQTRGLSFRSAETFESKLQLLAPLRFDRRGPALAVGDLDGDGGNEYIIGGTTKDPLRVVSGGRTFSLLTGEGDDGPVLICDVDGDGVNDLFVTKETAGVPRIFLNDGHMAFRAAPDNTLPTVPISAGAAVAADFDHDGRLDVFIGARVLAGKYPLAPRSVLLANHGGKFDDVTDAVALPLREVGLVTSALWSDVDGDGWIDLLVAVEWDHVKYFHNDRGVRFEDWTERAGFAASGTGWWTSLASADFNGDGRPDYVAGNAGLNTPYQADVAHPALLYYGEFGARGTSQIIEAYYESEKVYPRRTAKVLGAKIPSIAKRFPRNDAYAHATLQEIFSAEALEKARRFAANQLSSGVFLSQPDGRYAFSPLPRIAQIAPLQGIVTGDFDGDGDADIYAVQNSSAPIPAIGHFDGGLSQLLRGDGQGNFTAIPAAESGLVVPGDAKAVVAVDLDGDGWADFLVTRNNDTTLAFRNSGVPGRRSLRINLHGPAGNPGGIGARVTVEYADGSKQSAEIAANAGYYSQSAGCAFFGSREANPPSRLRVRWPSGPETVHAIPPGAWSVVARLQDGSAQP